MRDIAKDAVIRFDDVRLPPTRLSDELWAEQDRRWPAADASPNPELQRIAAIV
jgi:hypothetical protein